MKALKWLEKIEQYATFIFFLGAILLSLYGVFMRYVVNHPIFGLQEVIEILMPWAIFLAFGRALKENHHIAVDVVYDLFPFSIKRIIAVISNLLGAFYSFFLTYTGVQMIIIAKGNGFVSTADSIPIWMEYLILPVGMGLLGIYFLLKTYKAVIGDKTEVNGAMHQEHESYVSSNDQGGLPL